MKEQKSRGKSQRTPISILIISLREKKYVSGNRRGSKKEEGEECDKGKEAIHNQIFWQRKSETVTNRWIHLLSPGKWPWLRI